MIKTKKTMALLIAVLMLMSNCMGLFTNIAFAVQNNVTVEFSVERDSSAKLSDDGKTLNYECADGSSYDFKLMQNGQAITLTKQNDPEHGDKYIATGISSNENIKIYSPSLNLGVIQVYFSGNSIGMFPENENNDYYSQEFVQLADINNYQFRIQEVHQGENQPNPVDISNEDFTVDFGNATWTIDGKTTTASINGIESLSNGPVKIKGNTEIKLSNWDPNLMEVGITIEDTEGHIFSTRLFVDENNVTKIMEFDAENLPMGDISFNVQRKTGHNGNEQENIADTMYSVDFGEATWEIRNKTTVATVEGLDLTKGRVELKGDQVIKLSNWDSKLMQASIMVVDPGENEDRWFRERLIVNENGETRIMDMRADNMPHPENSYIKFYVERYQGELPENNLPEANTSANITVTGGADCKVSYINARLAINGYGIWLDDPEQNPELGNEIPAVTTIENFGYGYNESTDNGKVTISFGAIFLNKYVGKVSVNGVEFIVADYIDYSNRTDWLDHYSGQMVGFEVKVNKADNYNIVVNLDQMEGHYIAIGNFLWTDDPGEAESDLYIGNSTLEVISVKYEYDGQEIYVEEKDLDKDPHIEYNPYGVYGSLVVPEGATCTMKITPDYGYQVTSFGINGGEFVTGDAISVFEFPIHKGNFHLMAQVTPVDDVVDAVSTKVKSGTIAIGQNEIDSGTVILSVDDANPTDAKTSKFEETAGDYTIDSYLDISLDQVFYKGTAENVWTNEIHELNQEATIELELEEDLDNKSIIVIHNVGDGDEYEVIEIEGYNPETKTVTFKADSFSGYAIAVKDNANNPEDPEEQNEQVDPEEPNEPVNPENPNELEDPQEPEEPREQEKYTISVGDFTVVFSDDEGHEFQLTIMELLHLTPEELTKMDLTEEEYEQAKKDITKALEEYGTILNVYDISIDDEEEKYSHFGEVTIKIKMTDEMKKYNKFKLICIDVDTLTEKDIVELKVEGDYLVGNLFHLSNYALVAKNDEKLIEDETSDIAKATTEETTTEEVNNPKTGDNIIFYIIMFVISVVGTAIIIKHKK